MHRDRRVPGMGRRRGAPGHWLLAHSVDVGLLESDQLMFLTKTRAAVDGDRSPWGQFWFEPIGLRTSSGERITSMSAMRLSAVYSCVRVLAETFAVLPFCLYRKRTDGGRDLVKSHWLYRLMRKPNKWQTPFEWREMMQGHLCLRGNAYNQIVSNYKGEVTALVPMHPDAVTMKITVDGDFAYQVKQRDGTTITMPRGEVWHIRGLSSDGYIGMNPIELAAEVMGMGQAAQSYGARFFANDTKPGGWIEAPGKFADSDAKRTFLESWRATYGGANRGKTAVLEGGMKYNELKLNNSDSQFLESRKFSRSEIASVFRVPPHLIGDLEHATFSNIEQQSLDFVIYTMTPWAERWESSIETWLLFESEADDLEVEFDFANLLRGDRTSRGTFYTSGINAGWLTRNEARIAEGMNPLDGLDEPLRPLNMVEEGEAADELAEADAGADDTVKPKQPEPDARHIALAQAAAERVARKELQVFKAAMRTEDWAAAVAVAYQQHATFVASCLGVSIEAAQAYCTSRGSDPLTKGTEESDFMACALSKLERLALKGTL